MLSKTYRKGIYNMQTTPSVLQNAVETPFVLLCGGVLYVTIEVLWRGFSHWSMALCGAFCFLLLYRMNARYPRVPLPLRAIVGALAITLVELFVGCLLNLGLGLAVWDYSKVPLNFLGQICLPYSVIWFLLCFPVSGLTRLIRRRVFYADV